MSLDLEDRILDHLLFGAISVSQVDGMRRTVPCARDVFDGLIFGATQYSVYEGTWDTFAGGGVRYLAASRNEPGDLNPQRVPPGAAALVGDVMLRFRPRQPGEDIIHGHQMTTEAHQRLGEELVLALGGDYGDGVHAAGTRTYSKMMSARIADGFVHPSSVAGCGATSLPPSILLPLPVER